VLHFCAFMNRDHWFPAFAAACSIKVYDCFSAEKALARDWRVQ